MWRETVELYALADGPSQSLLRKALEAHQRARECREAVDRDGMTLPDRFGQLRAHPLLSAERDARTAFLNAMRRVCHLASIEEDSWLIHVENVCRAGGYCPGWVGCRPA